MSTQYALFVASRTKEMGSKRDNILHACLGCGTEAGELLTTAKKMWVYNQGLDTQQKDGQTNEANLIEEAGDLLFYVQMLCNHLNIDMRRAMEENTAKLQKRYPTGYSDAAAAERADKESPTDVVGEWIVTENDSEKTMQLPPSWVLIAMKKQQLVVRDDPMNLWRTLGIVATGETLIEGDTLRIHRDNTLSKKPQA